jgi:hypothetical protein
MPIRFKALTDPNADFRKKHPPMRKLTQPWKLRLSFGSQPVGNVDGPRWPEAGITTQEIPALPSWVTFREVQSSTADLPTCRPTDLPYLGA